MIISRFHPDGAQPLLAVVAGVLEAMGAQVRIDADGDNLVRASEPGDGTTLGFVIEAQGLPNLLHELVHVVQLGRLERDHGTPYRAILFDVENSGVSNPAVGRARLLRGELRVPRGRRAGGRSLVR
ncbi:MAG: hypothetical protein U1E76_04135 [Planctomycetota bacterium]